MRLHFILAFLLAWPMSASAMRCHNGLYLSPTWGQQRKTGSEEQALIKHMNDANITHVFMYANGIRADGTPFLAHFLHRLKAALPAVKITAMIGRRVCKDVRASHCFKLFDPASQAQLLTLAQAYWQRGFDGIQLDLEPVKNGDTDLLAILDHLKAKKPKGKLLALAGYSLALEGSAADQMKPSPKRNQAVLTWDTAYYKQLIVRIDQVMVMNYDTALWTAEAYKNFTRGQTQALLHLIPAPVELQMGLPSNVPGRTGLYDRKFENLAVGSEGIRSAIGQQACPAHFGVTVFTDAGMNAAMWEGFKQSFASGAHPEPPAIQAPATR